MANSSISSSLHSFNEASVKFTEEQEFVLYTNIRMVMLNEIIYKLMNIYIFVYALHMSIRTYLF